MKKIYSEKYLERALCDMVKKAGGLCIKLLCHQFLGLPDRLCLFPGGGVCFAEIKTTSGVYWFDVDKQTNYGYIRKPIDADCFLDFLEQYSEMCFDMGFRLWGFRYRFFRSSKCVLRCKQYTKI